MPTEMPTETPDGIATARHRQRTRKEVESATQPCQPGSVDVKHFCSCKHPACDQKGRDRWRRHLDQGLAPDTGRTPRSP